MQIHALNLFERYSGGNVEQTSYSGLLWLVHLPYTTRASHESSLCQVILTGSHVNISEKLTEKQPEILYMYLAPQCAVTVASRCFPDVSQLSDF